MAAEPAPPVPPPPPAPPPVAIRRGHPNPRVAQLKRTWYFFRRNTLAMVGLGILLALVAMAVYALLLPLDYYALQPYCATNQTNPNTYSNTTATIPVITGSQVGLTNGSYAFVVGPVTGYAATPSNGTFRVSGASVQVNISFAVAPTPPRSVPTTAVVPAHTIPAASLPTFPVKFVETGLPVGTFWSVTINNTSPTACLGTLAEVCTFPAGSNPPGAGCYETPAGNPSVIAPTFTTQPLSFGPLPMGSLTVGPGNPFFYDTWAGILRGSDWSLLISLAIVAGGAVSGLLLGAISGAFGGLVDEALMRLVDIFLSIPQILLVIIVVSVVSLDYQTVLGLNVPNSHIVLLVLAFLVTWWPFYARIVRGQVLVVREQKFVEAARASGARRGRIILRHIVPNSVYPVFIQMSLDVGVIPLFLGTLVFLGFTIFPSLAFPEWGSLSALSVGTGANDVASFLASCQLGACVVPWWQLMFPGLIVFLFAISVNFLSDGLRDALDPRLRR